MTYDEMMSNINNLAIEVSILKPIYDIFKNCDFIKFEYGYEYENVNDPIILINKSHTRRIKIYIKNEKYYLHEFWNKKIIVNGTHNACFEINDEAPQKIYNYVDKNFNK